MLRKENNRLIREFDTEQIWIEPWGANSLRVRVTKARSMPMPEEEWALLPPEPQAAIITIHNGEASHHQRENHREADRGRKNRLPQPDGARCCWKNSTATAERRWRSLTARLAGKSAEKKPEYLRTFVSAPGDRGARVQPHSGRRLRAHGPLRVAPRRKAVWHGAVPAAVPRTEGLRRSSSRTATRRPASPSAVEPGLRLPVEQPGHRQGHLRQERHRVACTSRPTSSTTGSSPATRPAEIEERYARADRHGAHDARLRHGLLAVQAALPDPGRAARSGARVQAPRPADLRHRRRFLPLAHPGRLEVRSDVLAGSRGHGRRS